MKINTGSWKRKKNQTEILKLKSTRTKIFS